jgi:hypothetical protein
MAKKLLAKFKFRVGQTVIVKGHPTDKRLWSKGTIRKTMRVGAADQKAYQITGEGDPVLEQHVSKVPAVGQLALTFKKKSAPKRKKKAAAKKKPATVAALSRRVSDLEKRLGKEMRTEKRLSKKLQKVRRSSRVKPRKRKPAAKK